MTSNIKKKTLILCGAIACPLFIIVVLIEGAIRPNYNSFIFPLSSLSIGDTGWIQISNFIFTGILLVAFSFGLKKVCNSNNEKSRGPILISLVGIGLIGAGVFSTDPIFGYPTDKPFVLRQLHYMDIYMMDFQCLFLFVCLGRVLLLENILLPKRIKIGQIIQLLQDTP